MENPIRGLPQIRFDGDAAEKAHDEWGANCGPGALAAMTGKTLDDVRPFLEGFDRKRYTNPKMMLGALGAMGVTYSKRPDPVMPHYGLARIQWHGPWMKPGVPPAARYRHTHWVGAIWGPDPGVWVFDINAVAETGGWVEFYEWNDKLVPWLLKQCEPKASGEWSVTHCLELTPP